MELVQDALKPKNGRPGLKQTSDTVLQNCNDIQIVVMFEYFEGIAYNMASSGSYGGNTTTAESARKVYKTVEIRERLVALCPDHYKFTFTQILFNSELN